VLRPKKCKNREKTEKKSRAVKLYQARLAYEKKKIGSKIQKY
jgi:hypothetical protein